MTDWSKPDSLISHYFTVGEMLWLPKWNRHVDDRASDGLTDQIKNNLIKLCTIMDQVREFLDAPIKVHSGYRPPVYSHLVGGSMTDVHTQGLAVDFDCLPHINCDDAKDLLEPMLEDFGLRMENNGPKAQWIHLDCRYVGRKRYFDP